MFVTTIESLYMCVFCEHNLSLYNQYVTGNHGMVNSIMYIVLLWCVCMCLPCDPRSHTVPHGPTHKVHNIKQLNDCLRASDPN